MAYLFKFCYLRNALNDIFIASVVLCFVNDGILRINESSLK